MKIYEDSIESKMRSISNAQGEFEIPHGVCGEIALKLVTQNGEVYTRKYDKNHVRRKLKVNKMKPLQRKVAVVDGATIYVTE